MEGNEKRGLGEWKKIRRSVFLNAGGQGFVQPFVSGGIKLSGGIIEWPKATTSRAGEGSRRGFGMGSWGVTSGKF